MNDPQAMSWLLLARQLKACQKRLGRYEEKAKQGTLTVSDLRPQDALLFRCMVSSESDRTELEKIASQNPKLLRLIR